MDSPLTRPRYMLVLFRDDVDDSGHARRSAMRRTLLAAGQLDDRTHAEHAIGRILLDWHDELEELRS